MIATALRPLYTSRSAARYDRTPWAVSNSAGVVDRFATKAAALDFMADAVDRRLTVAHLPRPELQPTADGRPFRSPDGRRWPATTERTDVVWAPEPELTPRANRILDALRVNAADPDPEMGEYDLATVVASWKHYLDTGDQEVSGDAWEIEHARRVVDRLHHHLSSRGAQ